MNTVVKNSTDKASDAPHILVLDDEPDLRELYELSLMRAGYRVHACASLSAARVALAAHAFDAIITDMRLGDGTGLDLLQDLHEMASPSRAIVITAYGSSDNELAALKAGAFDYISKPVDLPLLRSSVAAAIAEFRQRNNNIPININNDSASPPTDRASVAPISTPTASPTSTLITGPLGEQALARICGNSQSVHALRVRIAKAARGMAPVFVRGESGTGKELSAQAVHACSQRSSGPFIAVNCGAIPESLLEAEFFGALKGSYTGATHDRQGFFQAAHGGTLFLDEIGDLPLSMQAKLLRAIQERRIRPLGATQEHSVDVRIVSATHRDLSAAVRDKQFRQDLFYRLNVIELYLPPLRERREDIPLLCQVLLEKIAKDSALPLRALSPQSLQHLLTHPLEGNIRELENLLQNALAMCDGAQLEIGESLPQALEALTNAVVPPPVADTTALAARALATDSGIAADADIPHDLEGYLNGIEREILLRALQESHYNRTAAAKRLGITLRQIRYRMEQLQIEDTP